MIFQVSYHLYDLQSIKVNKIRQGALLKITWPDGLTGYADLHPWPEFGDAVVIDQLQEFKKLRLSPLIEQAIWLARRDALARKEGRSLCHGPVLQNNYLVQNLLEMNAADFTEIKKRDFKKLKIKLGRDLPTEAKLISSLGQSGDFILRLDFGTIPDWMAFERFMSSLGKLALSRIEYVEDPVRYSEDEWREARVFSKIAIDREITKIKWNKMIRPQADVVILKPARVDIEKLMQIILHWKMKATVTSSLDHPLGVMHAYALAQELAHNHPEVMLDPGCLTMSEYVRDEFSASIPTRGPQILIEGGQGIGFDQCLQKVPWKNLNSL